MKVIRHIARGSSSHVLHQRVAELGRVNNLILYDEKILQTKIFRIELNMKYSEPIGHKTELIRRLKDRVARDLNALHSACGCGCFALLAFEGHALQWSLCRVTNE